MRFTLGVSACVLFLLHHASAKGTSHSLYSVNSTESHDPASSLNSTFYIGKKRHIHIEFTLSTHYHYKVGQCGLMNQHMKLLVLLTLAISLHAHQVVLPPALSRNTFEKLKAHWVEEPADSLWDVNSIRQLLRAHNIRMAVAARPTSVPAAAVVLERRAAQDMRSLLRSIREAVQRKIEWRRAHRSRKVIDRTPQWLQQIGDFAWSAGSHFSDMMRTRQGDNSEELPSQQQVPVMPQRNMMPVYLHADSLFWVLETRQLQLYTDVAKAVRFNADLVAIANIIAANLRAVSPTKKFNGLHLRVENDWRVAKALTSEGEDLDLAQCAQLMRKMNFSTSGSPLYVASAIFNTTTGELDPQLCSTCSTFFHKQVKIANIVNRHMLIKGLLPRGSLPAVLHSEQAALLDFLVLQRANQVVGYLESSFSFNLREYRALAGWPRSSMALVNATADPAVVATFEQTATFMI